jgi:hypothetical protein
MDGYDGVRRSYSSFVPSSLIDKLSIILMGYLNHLSSLSAFGRI